MAYVILDTDAELNIEQSAVAFVCAGGASRRLASAHAGRTVVSVARPEAFLDSPADTFAPEDPSTLIPKEGNLLVVPDSLGGEARLLGKFSDAHGPIVRERSSAMEGLLGTFGATRHPPGARLAV